MMLENLFIELVVLFVAIAPFVAIWRYPASLLSKSLATVVALLFFMMILLGLLRNVARYYNQQPIIQSMQTIGRLLTEEKLPAEDISAVIHQWQVDDGQNVYKLKDMLLEKAKIEVKQAAPTEEPPSEP